MKQARDWSPRRSHLNSASSRDDEEYCPPLSRNSGENFQTQRPKTADPYSFNRRSGPETHRWGNRDQQQSWRSNEQETWRNNNNFQRVDNDQRQSWKGSSNNNVNDRRNNNNFQNSQQQNWRSNSSNINQQQSRRNNNSGSGSYNNRIDSMDQSSDRRNNTSSNNNSMDRRRSWKNSRREWSEPNTNADKQQNDLLPENKPRDARKSPPSDVRKFPGELQDQGGNERKLEQQVTGSNFQLMLYKRAVLSPEHEEEGWPHIVGSCLDMCPAEERDKRARLRDLAVFERLDGDQSKTSKELAVKKFCRTFSGKDLKQSDVRPLLVLGYTMEHLVRLLDMEDYPFEVVHDFLFDRTRAIRQELSMQRIINELAISIYENIVRFHIMSERELRQQRASGKVFDSHLNFQQLSKALLSLMNLYLVSNDGPGIQNETEFYCYYVLLNLNRPQQLSLWFQSVNTALLKSEHLQFARDVLKCYQQNNYQGFFRLANKATYLQACLIELYFNEVRAVAIKMINHGSYKLHPYPLCELASSLLMEPDDMEEFCSLHGLAVGVSASNEVQLLAKQAEFTPPKQPVRHYHCPVIENKRPSKFQELCSGNMYTQMFV